MERMKEIWDEHKEFTIFVGGILLIAYIYARLMS
jgi:hypothetical protein